MKNDATKVRKRFIISKKKIKKLKIKN